MSDNGNWELAQKKGASLAVRGEVCQYKSGCTHNSKISQNEGGDLSQDNDDDKRRWQDAHLSLVCGECLSSNLLNRTNH